MHILSALGKETDRQIEWHVSVCVSAYAYVSSQRTERNSYAPLHKSQISSGIDEASEIAQQSHHDLHASLSVCTYTYIYIFKFTIAKGDGWEVWWAGLCTSVAGKLNTYCDYRGAAVRQTQTRPEINRSIVFGRFDGFISNSGRQLLLLLLLLLLAASKISRFVHKLLLKLAVLHITWRIIQIIEEVASLKLPSNWNLSR